MKLTNDRDGLPVEANLTRPLPHSHELEWACLGACLLSPELIGQLRLCPADFHVEAHREIWLGLDALHAKGEPVDILMLGDELKLRGVFDKVGGMTALHALDEALPSLAHARGSARQLRELRRRRAQIVLARKYIAALYAGSDEIPTLEGEVLELLEERKRADVEGPQSIGVEEFISIPPRPYLVEGLIRERGAGIVLVQRGVEVTDFVLSLTWALVSGEQFLKFRVPVPRGVLLVKGNMPGQELQRRLRRVVRGTPEIAPFEILVPDMFEAGLPSLATSQGQAVIDASLSASPEVKMVVVDSSTFLPSGLAGKKGVSWSAVHEFVLRVRRRGVAVVLVHHSTRKPGRQSVIRRGGFSWGLDVRRPDDYQEQDGARFVLRFENAGAIAGEAAQPIDVRMIETNDGGLDWSWRAVEPTPSRKAKALAQLKAGQHPNEVAKAASVHLATVYRWKKEL